MEGMVPTGTSLCSVLGFSQSEGISCCEPHLTSAPTSPS